MERILKAENKIGVISQGFMEGRAVLLPGIVSTPERVSKMNDNWDDAGCEFIQSVPGTVLSAIYFGVTACS